LRGWDTSTLEYTHNIALCQHQIERIQPATTGKLFRPPHGQIRRAQFQKIKTDYQVIMWDVLTYDFDAALSPEVCLQRALKHTGAGSVVVFHDSVKAWRNVQYVLPRFLDFFANLGFGFAPI
jgi:peptidoglycan/xylan/chitin deacetylase (PgdA/CDA1 family)